MPISSLPSPYGIGTFGKAAYDFIDFLKKAGQSWWQILPVGPTSYGDSPYQSFSTYAGNPYFIDLDMLCEDGLLTKDEVNAYDTGNDEEHIDYEKIYLSRFELLKKAKERGFERDRINVEKFKDENSQWLLEYALFMSLKRHFSMKSWTEWDDDGIRLHKSDAVKKYSELLKDDVDFFVYIQYLFFEQWKKLREYAHKNGVGIIGDMPIYVAMDSADVWSSPENFQLDEKNVPIEVAGVPPDYFSEDGQLWGNPLYDWEHMEKDGYGWWIRRIGGASSLYDILRIDHFRGLESYWAVPYGETTAKIGRWVKGPGIYFVKMITGWFSNIQFIAEDLGILTPEVHELLNESGLPGMKVLEFAFDAETPSTYLPHRYDKNCVCYAGTHDNAPLLAWKKEEKAENIAFAEKYLGLNDKEGFCRGIIRGGMSSTADLFIAQMQDWLELAEESRMNTPGVLGGNWQWRMKKDAISDKLAKDIFEMTAMYGRKTSEKRKRR